MDAAITAAAVLAVVEPTMTGVGGDVFAIVYDARTRRLHGLNSSGRAGSRADADALIAKGITAMPADGVYPITVPGAVAGWAELLEQHGSITLARALEPAIGYARDGFAVSEIIAAQWAAAAPRLDRDAPPPSSAGWPGAPRRERSSATLISHGRWSRSHATAATPCTGPDWRRDRPRQPGARRVPDGRRLRRHTAPTGSIRSARPIAATSCTRCRRTRRDSSRSRCSTSSRATTSRRSATTAPTTCTGWPRPSASPSPIAAPTSPIPRSCPRRRSRR